MARKIRIIGASLCGLVVLMAIIAICIINSTNVSNIKGVAIKDTSDTSVALEWKSVEDVDGYEIYAKSSVEKAFKLATAVKDKKSQKASVSGLNPYTDYDFYVVGYRSNGDKKHISRKHKALATKTLPQRPTIKADSTMAGELQVDWSEVKSSAGYEVYYKGGDDENTEIIDKTNDLSRLYTDRKVGTEYVVQVRSFVYNGKNKIYSPWTKSDKITISDRKIQSSTIDPTKPMVALTFDDGPDYKDASERILNVLEQYNAKATFFMVGRNAAGNKDNLKRKVELGMEIGNHTYDHEHYGKNVTSSDIKRASDAIYKACGVYPTAFRSPGGNTTDTIRSECENENMPLYHWNLDTQDWKYRDADKVYSIVMKYVEDGDIILMHEIYGSTATAVEKMVPDLIAKGYQLVTCADLVKYKSGNDAVAGSQYTNATTIKNNTQ